MKIYFLFYLILLAFTCCSSRSYMFKSIGYAISEDSKVTYHTIQYKPLLQNETIQLTENKLLLFYVNIDKSLGLSKANEYTIVLKNRIGLKENIWRIHKRLTRSGELIFQIPSIIPGNYTLNIFYKNRKLKHIQVFFCHLDVFYSQN